ncbi:hypothetical protein [Sulfurimonas sp.]|nr:hypothetical protein [Sulfurimonas sp.]
MKKISSNELDVEISNDQIEWIKKDLHTAVKSYFISFAFLLGGIFTLLYDRELKDLAIGLFAFGIARILYK